MLFLNQGSNLPVIFSQRFLSSNISNWIRSVVLLYNYLENMDKKISLFKRLEIETHSMCNRTCPTCLRNSIPDKEATASWFEPNSLSTDDFKRVIQQCIDIGFRGEVCLSHYNEPLMDDRIVELAKFVKDTGCFKRIFFCSNADFLTEELAKGLDELINDIGFSFYMEDPVRSKRIAWVKTLFKKTRLDISPGNPLDVHMVTHYSPKADVIQLSGRHKNNPCDKPLQRLIINHKGEMLMCCDDLIGNFELGTIHDSSVEELWYGEKHQNYTLELMNKGGRKIHPHCLSCPRA